jgi:hypothetical protein
MAFHGVRKERAMCKRETYETAMPAQADRGAYEGKTVRLDQEVVWEVHEGQPAARRQCGFPFWMLWMIWPLLGLLKWAAHLTTGATTAMFDGIRIADTAPIAAIALMIAGLVLIIRS